MIKCIQHRLLLIGILLSSYALVHAQEFKDYIGQGNSQGIRVSSSITESGFSAEATLNGSGIDSAYMMVQASRFLEQATIGADRALIDQVAKMGFDAWIEEQFTLDPTSHLTLIEEAYDRYSELCSLYGKPYVDDDPICNQLEGKWSFRYNFAWFQAAMTAEDLLRQRVALALSEILVISGETFSDREYAFVLADYYDVLVNNAFGNYEDLLMEVSLHPAMGAFLSHFNNPRTNVAENIRPDENYAREIMQLFTIGLFELNQDGTEKLDENNEPIPTYDNNDIKELAKVFTGLGDGGEEGRFGKYIGINNVDFFVPMAMYEPFHEPGPKTLLKDFVIPDRQAGMRDIEMAVNYLFKHDNTGPFITRRLIQRLVKSNPTPAYIERVAAVFADNGQGVRGDLGAVVKAILLDEEARNCEWIDAPSAGKLREPILRYTHIMKALEAGNNTDRYWSLPYYYNGEVRQLPMFAPSVFNFFLPDYQPNGPITNAGLVAPEFQIHNTNTAIGYFNVVNSWTFWDYVLDRGFEYNATNRDLPDNEQVRLKLYPWFQIPNNQIILDELDLLLCGGRLSDPVRAVVLEAMNAFEDADTKMKMAVYLIMVSPDYTVTR